MSHQKTKKARDITLAYDWPSGAGMISTVCKKVLESSITRALMPTSSKNTSSQIVTRSYQKSNTIIIMNIHGIKLYKANSNQVIQ